MEKHLKEILDNMCLVVGAKDLDFKKDGWFMEYEWTEEEQEQFRKWIVKYLTENKEARQELMKWPRKHKATIEKFSREFIFNYGFKIK
jgi:aromatic ring-opening dioxygenase catalytic subunit (LigB family)